MISCRLESICPYGELPDAHLSSTWGYVQRPYDTYEQINGTLGFKASPYPGSMVQYIRRLPELEK